MPLSPLVPRGPTEKICGGCIKIRASRNGLPGNEVNGRSFVRLWPVQPQIAAATSNRFGLWEAEPCHLQGLWSPMRASVPAPKMAVACRPGFCKLFASVQRESLIEGVPQRSYSHHAHYETR